MKCEPVKGTNGALEAFLFHMVCIHECSINSIMVLVDTGVSPMSAFGILGAFLPYK